MTPKECRAARERLGLSLRGMAEALGISHMTWWRWEQPTTSEQYREPPPFLWRVLEHLEANLEAKLDSNPP